MGSGRRPLLILGEQHSGGSSGRRPPPSCFDGSYGVRRLAAAASSRCPLPAIGTSDLRGSTGSKDLSGGGCWWFVKRVVLAASVVTKSVKENGIC
nr:hypothetical protein Iba_chr03dCG3670 [Ipomoea batatas]